MTLLSHITKKWILFPATLLLLAVSGCTSVREAHSRVEYVSVYERDSVWVDCTDTLYVFERGDTVRIREKVTEREYHYTIFRDTLRSCDTLRYVEKVAVQSKCPKVRRWPWFLAGLCIGILIIFTAKILIKIYLKR
jgi:hypothetical protein